MADVYPDRFEDGDLSEYTGDTADFNVTSTGPSFGAGSFALELATTDATDYTINSASGLPAYPTRGDTIETRHYFDAVTGTVVIKHEFRFAYDDGAGEGYQVRVDPFNGEFAITGVGAAVSSTDSSVSYSADTEYRVEVNFDDGTVPSDTIQATLYNHDTSTQISQVSITDTSYTAGDIEWTIGHGGSGTSYIDCAPDAVAPSNLTATATSLPDDDIDLSWDAVTYVDDYNVYRAEASGSTTGDYTQIATVSAPTTTYSDANLEDGERFYYRVTSVVDGTESAVSNEADDIVPLPPPDLDSLDATTENEITLNYTLNDDSSDGTVDIYRGDPPGSLSQIDTVSNLGATSYTDTTLADGTEYEYQIRRATDHAMAQSGTLTATTVLPETTPTISDDDGDGHLTLVLENTADVQVTVTVEWRLSGGSFTADANSDVSVVGGATDTYTLEQLLTTDPIDVRTVATTDDASTTSGTDTSASGTVDPRPGRSILLNRADETTRWLPEDREPASLRIDREYNAMARWEAGVGLKDYDAFELNWLSPTTEAHIYWRHPRTDATSYLFRGYLEQLTSGARDATTDARGRDVLKKLTEGRQVVTYQSIATHDAIEDYLTSYTDFTVDLTQPSPTTLASDQNEQSLDTTSEWTAATSFGANEPLGVGTDDIGTLQTCWTVEAEDYDNQSGTNTFETADYSGDGTSSGDGVARELGDADTDFLEYQFTLDYTMPASAFELHIRRENVTGVADAAELTVTLDGPAVTNDTLTAGVDYSQANLAWIEITQADPSADLTPGTYTVTIGVASGQAGSDEYQIDVVAPLDNRFSYTFDDDVTTAGDGTNYLDGPQHYPNDVATELSTVDVGYNISAARIASTWTDTSNAQKLAVSNDGGSTFPLTASNSSTLDQSFASSDVGTNAVVRLTFGRDGATQTSTPAEGYQSQRVSVLDLFLDGNDLSVIDDREFRRSHFRNVVDMAEFADYRVVPLYDPNALEVAVFPKGTSNSADWTKLDHERDVSVEGYFNEVVVEGRERDDGTVPSATISDQAEITAVGQTLTLDIKDPTLTTDGDCESRARTVLSEVVNADEVQGTVGIVPTPVVPGYSYPVSGWTVDYGYGGEYEGGGYGGGSGSATRPLERVVYAIRPTDGDPRQGRALQGQLSFESDRVQQDPVIRLRRDTDQTRDSL